MLRFLRVLAGISGALDMQVGNIPDGKTISKVSDYITNQLFSGARSHPPTLDFIAPELDCSVRTLQRDLSCEGINFKQLLVELRKSAFLYYLNTGADYKLIAKRLQFKSEDHLKRWHRRHRK